MRATRRRWVRRRRLPGRRSRRVNLAAGECGVKDQVSRTQPTFAVPARTGAAMP